MTEIPWVLFLAATLAVVLSPGMDMMLVLSRGLENGARAALATTAGLGLGILCHTLIGAFGVGALIAASPLAFTALKIVGAAYLAWLGFRAILRAGDALRVPTSDPLPLGRVFFQGFIANIANPKVILFFLSFMPQFVPADSATPVRDLIVLGLVFLCVALVVKAGVGLAAGGLSQRLKSHPAILLWINRMSGVVLIAFGARLLFEPRHA
ncbi:MAG: LysE family translocator [Pseudomonadota bacterium]